MAFFSTAETGASATWLARSCNPQTNSAEIVSGQFAQNNGVHSNGGEWGGYMALREPDNTLQRWLYEAGYHTAIVGKIDRQTPILNSSIFLPKLLIASKKS